MLLLIALGNEWGLISQASKNQAGWVVIGVFCAAMVGSVVVAVREIVHTLSAFFKKKEDQKEGHEEPPKEVFEEEFWKEREKEE